ncbi:glutamyl-tRNA(Gln) amidotransferase subunit B, mitochondrial [Cylas formicarius]|uniref:glutamyl-tRNA(Gln) amidotransferase subunit B, mitochondrial n=1 Tax=Cylas formicarius TaxID=197179 RepID=UPI0029585055|nr:glutamyl-tRNA(Gln) amidotransferase subunit B, mitochondrial [Cylas formicarius]
MFLSHKSLQAIQIQPLKQYYSITINKSKWKSVVGLEVHAQIFSESKLFSGAATKFLSPVNTNVSLFDMATPGTLPILNKRCVEAGVLTALALNCTINPISYFDRKHYFYADLPAGYQITQQRAPLARNGNLQFSVFTTGVQKPYKTNVRLKQVQLEQDSGKSLHESDRSLVDLNRAGVPLMELVFEPDLTNGEEAAALIKELIIILQRLNTCSCKMEEGALRVDANVSIHQDGEPFGIRSEIKNIGSVRGVAGAVKFEIERQMKIKESGGEIVNETRAWDMENRVTVPMRDKEVQQDYRYMPEPNLPPLHLDVGPIIRDGFINIDSLKSKIPELPEQTRIRLREELGLTAEQCIILVNDPSLLELFIGSLNGQKFRASTLANFLINELNTALNKFEVELHDTQIRALHIGEIIRMLEGSLINRSTAKMVLDELFMGNLKAPSEIVEEKGWKQIVDEAELRKICQEVIDENEKMVTAFLKGKVKVFQALLGAVAIKTNKRADMAKCDKIMKELLHNIK